MIYKNSLSYNRKLINDSKIKTGSNFINNVLLSINYFGGKL